MLHPTFKATCVAHGLLEDDGEWKKWVEEAGDMQTGQQLCSLFITILLHCHPSLPHVLWNQFRVKICDELNHRLTAQGHLDPTEEDSFDYGLNLIHDLMQSRKTLKHYHDMPLPQQYWDDLVPNPLLQEQLTFDQEEMSKRVNQNYPHFNPEQKLAFDKVVDSAKNNKGKIFLLHSAGGCRKTYISNIIAAAFVQMGISLSVLPIQLLQPFFSRLVKLHIHVSRSPFPLMIPLPITLKGMTTSMRFSSVQNSSFGMKLLCSIDMALKP